MSDERCGTCRFWQRFAWKWKPHDRVAPPDGYCRRYPPRRVSGDTIPTFPKVHESNWCGEYREASPAAQPWRDPMQG